MNVGPTAMGEFDYRAVDALKIYGDWMRVNGKSIYGCTQSEYAASQDCRLTQNADNVYVTEYILDQLRDWDPIIDIASCARESQEFIFMINNRMQFEAV